VIPWFLREGDAARQEIARLREENKAARQLAEYLAEHYDKGDWETPAVQQEIRRLVKLATR